MARPDTVLDAIVEAIRTSGRPEIPSSTSYATFQLDTDGGQANVSPPVIEVTPIGAVRNDPHNTALVGHSTDDNGNKIGYIFEAPFDMEFQLDVWTAEGDGHDPDDIGRGVRFALYEYDGTFDAGPYPKTLPDPDGGVVDDIGHLSIDEGSPEPDLTMTPALRRWRTLGSCRFVERVDTAQEYGAEDYVTTVTSPGDGDLSGGTDVDIVFDATPSSESTADTYE